MAQFSTGDPHHRWLSFRPALTARSSAVSPSRPYSPEPTRAAWVKADRRPSPWESAQRRKAKTGRPWEIGGLEDHLLVLLVYYRCYVTQEFTGVFYRVDRSVVCRAIQRIEALAKPAFAVRREPKVTRREAEALIVDCTEQPIQRPGCDAWQRAHYSGKKRRHTVKAELVVTPNGRIASVSASHPGSRRDLTIRREGPRLLRRARLYADSAYQGYDREHPDLEVLYKKPKAGELAEEEKSTTQAWAASASGSSTASAAPSGSASPRTASATASHAHNTKVSIVAGLANLEAGFSAC